MGLVKAPPPSYSYSPYAHYAGYAQNGNAVAAAPRAGVDSSSPTRAELDEATGAAAGILSLCKHTSEDASAGGCPQADEATGVCPTADCSTCWWRRRDSEAGLTKASASDEGEEAWRGGGRMAKRTRPGEDGSDGEEVGEHDADANRPEDEDGPDDERQGKRGRAWRPSNLPTGSQRDHQPQGHAPTGWGAGGHEAAPCRPSCFGSFGSAPAAPAVDPRRTSTMHVKKGAAKAGCHSGCCSSRGPGNMHGSVSEGVADGGVSEGEVPNRPADGHASDIDEEDEGEEESLPCFCSQRGDDSDPNPAFRGVWVQCERCSRWCHGKCANLTKKQVRKRRDVSARLFFLSLRSAFFHACMHACACMARMHARARVSCHATKCGSRARRRRRFVRRGAPFAVGVSRSPRRVPPHPPPSCACAYPACSCVQAESLEQYLCPPCLPFHPFGGPTMNQFSATLQSAAALLPDHRYSFPDMGRMGSATHPVVLSRTPRPEGPEGAKRAPPPKPGNAARGVLARPPTKVPIRPGNGAAAAGAARSQHRPSSVAPATSGRAPAPAGRAAAVMRPKNRADEKRMLMLALRESRMAAGDDDHEAAPRHAHVAPAPAAAKRSHKKMKNKPPRPAAIDSPADTDKAGEISPQKPRQWPVFNLAMWQNDDDDDDPDKETCVICKVSMPLHTALGHVACPSLPSILPLATCPS